MAMASSNSCVTNASPTLASPMMNLLGVHGGPPAREASSVEDARGRGHAGRPAVHHSCAATTLQRRQARVRGYPRGVLTRVLTNGRFLRILTVIGLVKT